MKHISNEPWFFDKNRARLNHPPSNMINSQSFSVLAFQSLPTVEMMRRWLTRSSTIKLLWGVDCGCDENQAMGNRYLWCRHPIFFHASNSLTEVRWINMFSINLFRRFFHDFLKTNESPFGFDWMSFWSPIEAQTQRYKAKIDVLLLTCYCGHIAVILSWLFCLS